MYWTRALRTWMHLTALAAGACIDSSVYPMGAGHLAHRLSVVKPSMLRSAELLGVHSLTIFATGPELSCEDDKIR